MGHQEPMCSKSRPVVLWPKAAIKNIVLPRCRKHPGHVRTKEGNGNGKQGDLEGIPLPDNTFVGRKPTTHFLGGHGKTSGSEMSRIKTWDSFSDRELISNITGFKYASHEIAIYFQRTEACQSIHCMQSQAREKNQLDSCCERTTLWDGVELGAAE